MKKGILFSLILGIILYPQVTFAAWWNPFTWFDNWQLFKQEAVQQDSLIDKSSGLQRMMKEESEKKYVTKPSEVKNTNKGAAVKKVQRTVKTTIPIMDKTVIQRLEALRNQITKNNLIITNNTAPGLRDANTTALGYQYTLLDLVDKEIDRLKKGENPRTDVIAEYENLEIRTIGLYNQQVDAFEASTQQSLKQIKNYGQQMDQANQFLREMMLQMQSANSAVNKPAQYQKDPAIARFETEWKQYNDKLAEVKEQLLKEYQAAGGYWTASQLEYNAIQKLKDMGVKLPVSPYTGYIDQSGSYSSTICHPLNGGYDCYGPGGTRIQTQQINNGSFQINSW